MGWLLVSWVVGFWLNKKPDDSMRESSGEISTRHATTSGKTGEPVKDATNGIASRKFV